MKKLQLLALGFKLFITGARIDSITKTIVAIYTKTGKLSSKRVIGLNRKLERLQSDFLLAEMWYLQLKREIMEGKDDE